MSSKQLQSSIEAAITLSTRHRGRHWLTLAGSRFHQIRSIFNSFRWHQPNKSRGEIKELYECAACNAWGTDTEKHSDTFETKRHLIKKSFIKGNKTSCEADDLSHQKDVRKARDPEVSKSNGCFIFDSAGWREGVNIGVDSISDFSNEDDFEQDCIVCKFNLKWKPTVESHTPHYENTQTIGNSLEDKRGPEQCKIQSNSYNSNPIQREKVTFVGDSNREKEDCNDNEGLVGGARKEDDFDESSNHAHSSNSSIMQHARHAHHASKAHHTRSHQHHSRHRHAHHHHMHHRHQHMHGGHDFCRRVFEKKKRKRRGKKRKNKKQEEQEETLT
ncbi:hypothetical protein ElyMa_005718800 [Elysia marginata]|uniref:Uncharacterized protein n=1 Tax=Elysia marginata TaxID=1093978 RepID=A0AAV4FIT8_9GAST|nr:hypothetical protein ElyMa_005718800 [Elysia marginata]